MSEEYEEYPDEYLDENGNPYEAEPEQKRGELKPCPFCGTLPQANAWIFRGISETRYFCPNQECPLSVRTVTLEDWNTRPIEDALNARIAELRDVIGDYRNDASRVLDEKCPSDERHCGCVPILRDQLNKYQKALILITTMPELSQATTIAREALQERGKFIWTEQSVGEYWVTKLDILQDRFDALEKDYADVCQKRLEAADVFSRQIIELESENAELKAERRWIPVSEMLPEDGREVLVFFPEGFITAGSHYQIGADDVLVKTPSWLLGFEKEVYGWNAYDAVTHWLPLPEPPEVEE